jgi:hypothetical protein
VSGLEVEYTTDRTAETATVTRMALSSGKVLYDAGDAAYAATGGYAVDPYEFRSLATTFYIAAVAQALGIPMYDEAFQPLTTTTDLAKTVVRRATGSAIKDYESLAQFIAAQCAANTAKPGFLPHTWNAVPARVVCSGAGCP